MRESPPAQPEGPLPEPRPGPRGYGEGVLQRLRGALASHYWVEREIGHGGMGMVYLARDLRHGRLVAVKVLRPEFANSLGAERFLREIQTAAQLTHPHILPLHDSGEADGLIYYIMPYVEGESLRDRLERERQLPLSLAVALVRQVADALAYAHAHGVVHRDIKPENILLLENDQAMLADFGLARAIRSAANQPLTPTGLVIGSPVYMSPEQAVGERKLDGRADIYSLGCVLFEMLAGVAPFRGPNVQAIARRKITELPPSLRSERPAVPVALERVVIKAMATAPEACFQEVAHFSAALERAVAARGRLPRWLFAAAAVAVILSGVAGYRLLRTPPAPLGPQPQVLVADFQGEGVDPEFAGMVSTSLRINLSQSRFVRVVEPRQVEVALQRMQQTEIASLDLPLAREVAMREGFEGVVSGTMARLGPSYLLAVLLIEPASGQTIVALRETATDSNQLHRALDSASKQLRSRIGESVRSIRPSEPLERVTTASLDALRKYS
jgi:eukaryotic-like serine/threonine-protein kinase